MVIVFALASMSAAHAQFTDCSTGLLQMPTAEMQKDGTLMITKNFLNKHSLTTSGWDYNTFQYGLSVSFWERIEVGYVCTIFNGAWSPKPNKTERESIMRNQDRHFVGRVCLLREGEFGQKWMPALVVGVSDPTTGVGGDYIDTSVVSSEGNGFFNRNFVVLTKHFSTPGGVIGAHVGYQFNRRTDYAINASCFGVNWQPVWLQQKGLLDSFNVIAV